MDEWLEKWLADGKPIDLGLRARLTPHLHGVEYQRFEDGAREFLTVLRQEDRLSIFGLGWNSLGLRMWEDEEAFIQSEKERMQQSEYYDEDGRLWIEFYESAA